MKKQIVLGAVALAVAASMSSAGIIGFGASSTAYDASVVPTYNVAPGGTLNAAIWIAAQGSGRIRTLTKIILPQALARTIPPLCNQSVSLVKDSSIVSLISIQELTFMATDIGVSTRRIYEIWLTVALVYFLVCFAMSSVFTHLERRFAARR